MPAKGAIRKRAADTDADDAPPDAAAPAAPPPAKLKKKKKAGSGAAAGPALCFEEGLEGEGEEFKVKKKKKRSQHAIARDAAPLDDDPAAGVGATTPAAGSYSADMLQQLRQQSVRAGTGGDAPLEGDVAEEAQVNHAASAEAIRVARAQRERERRLASEGHAMAGPDGVGYIPLDDKGDAPGSRLVRETSTDEPSVFDDQNGAQLRFGNPLHSGGGGARIAESSHVVDLDEDEEAAAGGGGRGGGGRASFGAQSRDFASRLSAGGPVLTHAGNNNGYSGGARSDGNEDTSAGPALVEGSEAAIAALAAKIAGGSSAATTAESLKAEVRRFEGSVSEGRTELAKTQRSLEACAKDCGELERTIGEEMAGFEFLQRSQAYSEDLIDCLNEKAPLIEACEASLLSATEERGRARRASFEVAEAAERAAAEAVLRGAWRAPAVPTRGDPAASAAPPPAPPALDATGGGWDDGSAEDTDDEAEGASAASEASARLRAAREQAEGMLSDVAPEFCELKKVRRRFSSWRANHAASYNDTYLELCIPTLLAPLVRHELQAWRPLRDGAIEERTWHMELSRESQAHIASRCAAVTGVTAQGKAATAAELADALCASEAALLAQLVCKLALPRLQHTITHAWDTASSSQGKQLAIGARHVRAAVETLVKVSQASAEAGSADAEEDAAAAEAADNSLRGMLMSAAARLEGAVEDVCIPPCVEGGGSADADALAAAACSRRRLCRAVKLLGSVCDWADLLAVGALQELGGTLLASHIIPHLRLLLASAPPPADFVIEACERSARALPAAWRGRGANGAHNECTFQLYGFVKGEVAAALAAAAGGAASLQRLSQLVRFIDGAAES